MRSLIGTAFFHALQKPESVRVGMEAVMGPFPAGPRARLRVEVQSEERVGTYRRRHLTYEADEGDPVPAWLLIPDGAGKHPAALCLHQTTRTGKDEPAGLSGKPDLHYAHELALRGFVTLAPDYPNFGEYVCDAYSRGYASASMKGIWNHARAVDLLAAMQEVDSRRIGVIGHSLGGHNALFLAVFEPRVRTIVTSCGFTRAARYYKGDLTGWSHKGYMPRIADYYGKSPERLPFDFPAILAAIAPRRLFINAPLHDGNFDVEGVRECVRYAQGRFPPGHLLVEHPDCGHEFPDAVRRRAYEFVGRSQGLAVARQIEQER